MKRFFILIMILSFILCGCKSKNEASMSNDISTKKNVTKGVNNPTVNAGQKSEEKTTATSSPIPIKSSLILPKVGNDTGKVLIQTVSMSINYPFNSYIITSKNGESVVVDPTQMPAPSVIDFKPAAILSTHPHDDHKDDNYLKNYSNIPTILYTKGDIKTKDFHIYSILSSHNGDSISEGNQNVILVMEVDGLRIAHMGDIGQTKLTKDQLSKLGKIDIAFMQFENTYSDMTIENKKGFNIIKQLNPKVIIPTHFTSISLLQDDLGKLEVFDNILEISKEDLPDTKLNIYHILNDHKYR